MDDITDLQQSNDDLKKKVDLLRQQSLNRARTLQSQLLQAHAPVGNSSGNGMSQNSASASAASLPTGGGPSQSQLQSKRIVFAMSKLSLLSITLSLMILGALVFVGGFLTGYWTRGGAQLPPHLMAASGQGGYAPGSAAAAAAQGLDAIGFQHIAAQQSQLATENLVGAHNIPGIPNALQPLASSVQFATGQALANRVGQNVNQSVGQGIATAVHPHGGTWNTAQQQGAPQTNAPSQTLQNTGVYTVQLGIFSTQENAQELVQRLQTQDYVNAEIITSKSPMGDMIYTVQSGRYPDYQTATAVAAQFVTENIPGAMVIKIKPQGVQK